MKKLFFLLSLLILTFLCGCSHTAASTPSETPPEVGGNLPYPQDDFFDYAMQKQPTEAAMTKIHDGMTFSEVVEIIGRPHGIAPLVSTSGYFKWITTEGNMYVILFWVTGPRDPEMSLSEYYKDAVVCGEPTGGMPYEPEEWS